MNSARRSGVRLTFVLAALSVSCGDTSFSPTAPEAFEEAVQLRVVRFSAATAPEVEAVRLDAHRDTYSATARIDRNGGTITVQNVTLVIPQDALSEPVDITLRLPADDYASIEMEPHGLVFNKLVQINYGLKGANLDGIAPSDLAGVYTGVPLEDGTARAWEVIEPRISGDTFTFYTSHFSKYLLALAGFILVGG